MKTSWRALLVIASLAFTGCNLGTAGGPGVDDPQKTHFYGATDETFNLTVAPANVRQGEVKVFYIGIKRALNFDEDVTLELADLPTGLSVDNTSPTIKHGESQARFLLTAANDASLGEFSLKVTGHPTKGNDATNDLKITVDRK
jgi:hypothetical protein